MARKELRNRSTLLLLMAIAPAPAAAIEDFRVWGSVTAITKLGSLDPSLDKWRLWLESQGRFRDQGSVLDQTFGRAGLGYALSDKVSVWLGYGHFASFLASGNTQHEDRVWQQALLTEKTALGDVSSRTRIEQRIIEGVAPVEWRARQQLRLSHPLGEGSPFSLIMWNELFIRLNSTTPSARFGFDQNRGFAGLGYTFSQQARLEVGYMNQLILSRSTAGRSQKFGQRMNHTLSLALFLNL